jgi:hypothetical protein
MIMLLRPGAGGGGNGAARVSRRPPLLKRARNESTILLRPVADGGGGGASPSQKMSRSLGVVTQVEFETNVLKEDHHILASRAEARRAVNSGFHTVKRFITFWFQVLKLGAVSTRFSML